MIPYGRQGISQEDIDAVDAVLRSDWLTQGPNVVEFEKRLATYCGTRYAVAVSSGTAALLAAYKAAGLSAGDEFITTPLTFPATSNAGVWLGAKPVFVDVDAASGNIDVSKIEVAITPKTKLIAPVDFTGRPVDIARIMSIAEKHKLVVVEDACQALGARYKNKKIGSVSDLTVFSFHPVKGITTGEGGAILTNNQGWYRAMKAFITHGVVRDSFLRKSHGDWYFEMQDLGLNFRLTDFQSALGMSQLSRIEDFLERRRQRVERYRKALGDCKNLQLPLPDDATYQSAWHLFVVRLQGTLVRRKAEIFRELRASGIGVQVHHIPVHLHPFYEQRGYAQGSLPVAERFYEEAISLPLYPDLTHEQQDAVIQKVRSLVYI